MSEARLWGATVDAAGQCTKKCDDLATIAKLSDDLALALKAAKKAAASAAGLADEALETAVRVKRADLEAALLKLDADTMAELGGGMRGAMDARGVGTAVDAAKQADEASTSMAQATKRFAQDHMKMLVGGGMALAAAAYVDHKFAKAKEDTKQCIKLCLPVGWDEYKYGNLGKDQLQYKTQYAANDAQPICNGQINDCEEYCGEKCDEIHQVELPGEDAVDGLADKMLDGVKNIFEKLFTFGISSFTGMVLVVIIGIIIFNQVSK